MSGRKNVVQTGDVVRAIRIALAQRDS
jgi:hypothetical protein